MKDTSTAKTRHWIRILLSGGIVMGLGTFLVIEPQNDSPLQQRAAALAETIRLQGDGSLLAESATNWALYDITGNGVPRWVAANVGHQPIPDDTELARWVSHHSPLETASSTVWVGPQRFLVGVYGHLPAPTRAHAEILARRVPALQHR